MTGLGSANYYERLFSAKKVAGRSIADAAAAAVEAFLDGKPARSGKFMATDRHQAFWSSAFLMAVSLAVWLTEPMVLALARYMGQQCYRVWTVPT